MRATLVALLTFVLGACGGSAGRPPGTMCSLDTDCEQGENCREGLCFGNPPPLEFAARLLPPSGRPDLALTEIERFGVSSDGFASPRFGASVLVSGRVVISTDPEALSVGARVVFRRPSRIEGLGDYLVSATSMPGKAAGEIAFQARLDPNISGEQYELSVYPDDGTLFVPARGQLPPSDLVPPLRKSLPIKQDLQTDISLGDPYGLVLVQVVVKDAAARPLAGMVVKAYGRYAPASPLELASSVSTTDPDGNATFYVPVSWQDDFDLKVSGLNAPTLTRHGVALKFGPDAQQSQNPLPIIELRYPTYPNTVPYQLPISGPDSAGGMTDVVGATVHVSTVLVAAGTDDVTYEADGSVKPEGYAKLWLVPGTSDANRTYDMRVVPPANDRRAALWLEKLVVGPPNPATGEGGVLAELDLDERVYVTGQVLDRHGVPAPQALVRVQPSAAFTADLDPDAAALVATMQFPEVQTDELGRFGLYLDRSLLELPTSYDFDLIPPASSLLPRWSYDLVQLGKEAKTMDLMEIYLPKASLASGTVLDPTGAAVADAEARVYVEMHSHDTSSARLRTLTRSDGNGELLLVLPAP